MMLYKKKVFSSEIPGPAHVLLTIFPTPIFHQNTNRGLRKRIRLFLSFKILSHPKPCVYFQLISQKDI